MAGPDESISSATCPNAHQRTKFVPQEKEVAPCQARTMLILDHRGLSNRHGISDGYSANAEDVGHTAVDGLSEFGQLRPWVNQSAIRQQCRHNQGSTFRPRNMLQNHRHGTRSRCLSLSSIPSRALEMSGSILMQANGVDRSISCETRSMVSPVARPAKPRE